MFNGTGIQYFYFLFVIAEVERRANDWEKIEHWRLNSLLELRIIISEKWEHPMMNVQQVMTDLVILFYSAILFYKSNQIFSYSLWFPSS